MVYQTVVFHLGGSALSGCQDLKRSVEYLLTRHDINAAKLGYIGLSWRSAWAPVRCRWKIGSRSRYSSRVAFIKGRFRLR